MEQINAILWQYRNVLPLTIRQIFYRLVVEYFYEKTERGYERLCETLNRARRARLLEMDVIRDDGFYLTSIPTYSNADEVIDVYLRHAGNLNVDRQAGQASRLIVWCEAQGMKPMLEGVTVNYGVPVASSGGFDSTTTKHNMANVFAAQMHTEVLHVGDYDPSGVHMFSSLQEDVQAFIDDLSGDVTFTRLAVTPDQRDQYDLPTAPPKKTDRRSFNDTSTVQCEALPPDVLLEIVEFAINLRIDPDIRSHTLKAEEELRRDLLRRLKGITE
ncbi:hypothetical protein Q6D67_11410 [Haliea sp. E1-2-M8]|uniref:hypothetical protein n=1 Tax=Haliea sp. E1-2-M8 TaxID=3064706 RepID=UPI002727A21C|nr:hypothetical protein [Haliea sp. E1-2-M8]MDO8862310.1 hypothetical protein [Haliea sp. E1-2-M8]